jgi:hypothetical protein
VEAEVCGHVLHDPKISPDIAKAIFIQSTIRPVKLSPPVEQPEQNKS